MQYAGRRQRQCRTQPSLGASRKRSLEERNDLAREAILIGQIVCVAGNGDDEVADSLVDVRLQTVVHHLRRTHDYILSVLVE